MKVLKNWKRNIVTVAVMLFICAGVYLNWSYTEKAALPELTQTLNPQQVMGESTLVINDEQQQMLETDAKTENYDATDYFSTVRLSRQESRDEAVSTLQETMAYEDSAEEKSQCAASLDGIISTALEEAQIESLVIAKGFADCVTYISDDIVSVAVSAPAEGLGQEDVALISDVVTTQTNYALSDVRIIEVK